MFNSIDDFLTLWKMESERTRTLFAKLTDEALASTSFHPNVRSIRALSGHIIKTSKELLERTGLHVHSLDDDDPNPHTTQSLMQEFERMTKSVHDAVQTEWTDADLDKTDEMYGETWTRKQSLFALITHLIHHRGGLTILMRLANLKVPGIYGPAKEEWVLYSMEPPVED